MSEPIHINELIPPECLTTRHLLEVVAGAPLSDELLRDHELPRLMHLSDKELEDRGAVRHAARRLTCAFELSRRLALTQLEPGKILRSTREIFDAYHERLRHETKEHFISLLMTAKSRLIREEVVSIGTLTASLVHPREVFKQAIRHSAAGIILVHNHPSGDPEPSQEDHEVTQRLSAASQLIGIRLLDHLVIADGAYVSFLERGML